MTAGNWSTKVKAI